MDWRKASKESFLGRRSTIYLEALRHIGQMSLADRTMNAALLSLSKRSGRRMIAFKGIAEAVAAVQRARADRAAIEL